MSDVVVIVGGGLAGLAASVALAQRGIRCTLLESRPRLGGRASSFHDAESDQWVDNCQHVAMGCCTNFHHFCQATGLDQFFARQSALNFVAPDGRCHRFHAGPWPAPLHLAGAFARLSYLTWSDKLALARGLKALARERRRDDGRSFADWLVAQRQPANAVQRFWKVVLVSALSESLDRISLPQARKVFVDGFLSHRDGWFVDIPTAPLEDLYGGVLTQWLEAHGVTIRRLSAVESVEVLDGRAIGARLKSGENLAGDQFIVSAPWHRALSLLPGEWAAHPQLAGIARLEAAPISSVHLWFDRPITVLPHAVFVEGLVQWVFHRSTRSRESNVESPAKKNQPVQAGAQSSSHGAVLSSSDPQPFYYQVVISASRDLLLHDAATIRDRVLAELANVWPAVKAANLQHWRLVTEHRAVFSVTPGSDALRPPQQSPIRNLQLAGDWTQTGWPATMEGAVRSGYLAAENVLSQLGRPERLLQPDLPTAGLSRWLFGL